MTNASDSWPAGATWVFQGTVAEDATAGTHICTLTVTPGMGNELEVLYGFIRGGATVTAQAYSVLVNDGTNLIVAFTNGTSSTTSGATFTIGPPLGSSQNVTGVISLSEARDLVSGTMQLVLQVSTTAVSVTQTFAVACRIRGAVPTATLADTVGTPVLTTNTSAVF